MHDSTTNTEPDPALDGSLSPLVICRLGVGGVFMGLANLVPGISGGTMLVAAGVYERFIGAISDLTRFKLRASSILTVGIVVVSALIAIVALASLITLALSNFLWGMYALFIGLTLGGAPVLWKMLRPMDARAWIGFACGLIAMLAVVVIQESAGPDSGIGSNTPMLIIAGVAGASAMILPGLSGAYILLLLGQYQPILSSISRAKEAASDGSFPAAATELRVLVPVGIGVVLGIVVVSNILRYLLRKHHKVTIGVLLGLLIGAPAGLYPFREGRAPEIGDVIKGETVTEDNLEEMREDPKDWEKQMFTPNGVQIAGALGMMLLGMSATLLVARLGEDQSSDESEESEDAASS